MIAELNADVFMMVPYRHWSDKTTRDDHVRKVGGKCRQMQSISCPTKDLGLALTGPFSSQHDGLFQLLTRRPEQLICATQVFELMPHFLSNLISDRSRFVADRHTDMRICIEDLYMRYVVVKLRIFDFLQEIGASKTFLEHELPAVVDLGMCLPIKCRQHCFVEGCDTSQVLLETMIPIAVSFFYGKFNSVARLSSDTRFIDFMNVAVVIEKSNNLLLSECFPVCVSYPNF